MVTAGATRMGGKVSNKKSAVCISIVKVECRGGNELKSAFRGYSVDEI